MIHLSRVRILVAPVILACARFTRLVCNYDIILEYHVEALTGTNSLPEDVPPFPVPGSPK